MLFIIIVCFCKRKKIQMVLNNTFCRFPAADILVLVSAAHMSEAAFFKRIKCHWCSIMITGKKITSFMREPLPAFEPECLFSQLKRAPVNK